MKGFKAIDSFGDTLTMDVLEKDAQKHLSGMVTVIVPSEKICLGLDSIVVLKRTDIKRLIKWLQKSIEE